ncbi:Fpg/Nei family DNA glycosylase [Amnibacterium setariae]|uniref:Fpg/Nei family DNA glycosylase n=1 Tax=Amnibacterium setariae TaxID=2306585 RepID=A0A3A1TWS1_9MICO|nr:DNA-formamidopyrimidine glycosylase family protein [Amnibacterium setariae]RIX28693.1 Fpg/Nei family DNA glycosylase [Amnibacterium setariae]
MPEMPEVHALADDLAERMVGHAIARFDVLTFSALKTFDPPATAVIGLEVRDVTHFGKFLDVDLGDLHVVVHLAKAGWMRWYDVLPTARNRVIAARIGLDDGSGVQLTEAGTKKSLSISVVRNPLDVERVATLGPDPLDDAFTVERFAEVLAAAGKAQIKGVLRDQARIAGIGNAYSDEILHAAKMSPFKPAAMPPEDVERLYDAMRTTLADAIRRSQGLHMADLKGEKKAGMRVHGRTGEACPVCGDTIRQVRFADNSLQYCPTCQTGGKPLADRALSRLGITL